MCMECDHVYGYHQANPYMYMSDLSSDSVSESVRAWDCSYTDYSRLSGTVWICVTAERGILY